MNKKKSTHFEISERKILLRIIDVIVACFAIVVASKFFEINYFSAKGNYVSWFVVLSGYTLFFGTIFELYDLQKSESKFTIFKNLTLTVLLTGLFFLMTPVYTPPLPENRIQILLFLGILLGLLYLWRLFYIIVIASPRFYKRVLIVGDAYNVDNMISELQNNDPNFEVKGYINTDKDLSDSSNCKRYQLSEINQAIKEQSISEIVVANSFQGVSAPLYQELVPLLKQGFPIKAYSHIYEEITDKVPVTNVKNDFYCYFPFSRSNKNKLYLAFQRIVDVLISLAGLTFFILILPFVLLLNLFWNRGSLFYKQERIGKNGKIFEIIKLRTMVKNAEKDGAQWAQKNDHRVTKFGKVLRRTRLDEIPQFINVLKGDMAFIGPRPERPCFVKQLSEKIPFYEIRHVIKPGLTGWAQVNSDYGSSEKDSLEKLQYDLYYIKRRNVFLDIRIFLKTMSAVVFFRGQ
ncbi:MAG: exopolysaccharide biosynthesis polyprenyl glycosylphosphotransferase [Bacteroidota bacterium]